MMAQSNDIAAAGQGLRRGESRVFVVTDSSRDADFFVCAMVIGARVQVGEYSTDKVLTIPHIVRKLLDLFYNILILLR
jgi:hypothetical protein